MSKDAEKKEEIKDYLNCWADLDSEEYKDLRSRNGKKTQWAKGYRKACMDIFDKLRELGLIGVLNKIKNGKIEKKRKRLASLLDGLSTDNSSLVCSAAYLYSINSDFENFEEDFHYEQGYGIVSHSIRQNLPIVFDIISPSDWKANKKDRKVGQIFKGFSNLKEIAILEFNERTEEPNDNLRWKVSEIRKNFPKIKKDILKLRRVLNEVL